MKNIKVLSFIAFFSLIDYTYAQKDTLEILTLVDSAYRLQLDEAKPILNRTLEMSREAEFKKGVFESQYKLARLLARSGDFDGAIDHLRKAPSSDNYSQDHLSAFSNFIGICFVYMGKYDSTESYFLKTLAIKKELKDSIGIGTLLNNLGNVNISKGNLEKSTSYFVDALRVRTLISDSAGIASTTNNLGIVFYKRKMFQDAIDNYLIALDINRQFKDSSKEALILNNLGNSYDELEKFDISYDYYKTAYTISDSIGDARLLGISSSNLGVAELRLNNFKESETLFLKSLEVRQVSKDEQGEAEVYNELASLKLETGNPSVAKDFFFKSLAIARRIESPEIARENLLGLSETYAALKNFKDAFEMHQQYVILKDSILNTENQESLNQLVTQYETEKKEQQIALQEAEISEQEAELKRRQTLLISSFVLIITIIALALTQRSRLKKKQELKLQEAKLEAREAEIKATISSQERERARYARDLHDGFGQMISVLNMNIGNLNEGAKPDERQKVFEASTKVIDEMYGELKNICFDLMPQTLVKSGLTSALDEFVTRINNAGKISIELNSFGLDDRLSEVQEISLFRISQEWINNILKYSDAEKVTLQITKDDEEITLLIEDNGSGFDKSLLSSGKGNGWKNLNTRANLIKGELELETNPGSNGNTLIVNAPSIIENTDQYIENTVEMV